MSKKIISKMDESIYNELDNLIDYYVEMKDYIKHVEDKKDRLKKIIIEILQYKEISSYNTNNVTLNIRKSKLKKNSHKNELIDYIIKYKKTNHIKININDKLINYLNKDENTLNIFKTYISNDDKEESKEHGILIDYINKKIDKQDFLDIKLDRKNKELSPEDEEMAKCLKAYKDEEISIKLETRKIRQAV